MGIISAYREWLIKEIKSIKEDEEYQNGIAYDEVFMGLVITLQTYESCLEKLDEFDNSFNVEKGIK